MALICRSIESEVCFFCESRLANRICHSEKAPPTDIRSGKMCEMHDLQIVLMSKFE